MTEKKKKKKKPNEPLVEDERDPAFLEAPPEAPPVPGVAPSEAPQIDEDTEVEQEG